MLAKPDPFPAVPYQDARRLLKLRFGDTAVQWEEPFGPVVIRIARPARTPAVRSFTWQQAKYLALHPKVFRDVIRGRYPKDWPAA